MEPKQPNNPSANHGAPSPKKRPVRRLPLSKRIYRAVYTFFYVAAQLVKECALFLFEKAKNLPKKAQKAFAGGLYRLKKAEEQRKSEKIKEAEAAEKGGNSEQNESVRQQTTVAGRQDKGGKKKSLKSVFSSFGGKKQQYADRDFLDFEEETGGGFLRKKKKKELPTFDEVLYYKEERRQRRQQRARTALVRFLAVVLGVQILAFAFGGGLYLYTGYAFSIGTMEVHLKEGGQTVKYSVSKKTGCTEDGGLRIDMTALASFLELETVSDKNYVYYTLADGKRIVFIKDSKTALLDGSRITLSDKVSFVGTRVYVPVELITDYTEGIGVSYSEKENRLTLTRQKDEDLSNSREEVYKDWRLLVSSIERAPLPRLEQTDGNQ